MSEDFGLYQDSYINALVHCCPEDESANAAEAINANLCHFSEIWGDFQSEIYKFLKKLLITYTALFLQKFVNPTVEIFLYFMF